MNNFTATSDDSERKIYRCDECGFSVLAEHDGLGDIEAHVKDCDGETNPRRRFDKGDRVETSEFGLRRLNTERKHGRVVGFCHEPRDHCVRIKWDTYKSTKTLAHYFVRHERSGE